MPWAKRRWLLAVATDALVAGAAAADWATGFERVHETKLAVRAATTNAGDEMRGIG